MIGAPNVALVGFMGSGKTSVGEAMSALTGMPFHDVDRIVEEREGVSVAEIFTTLGEVAFRARESAVFRVLCEGSGNIIGCGGGTLIDPRNMAAMRQRCVGVWLRTSVPGILERIDARGTAVRPLLQGGAPEVIVPRLLSSREALYAEADLVVDTDGRGVVEIAEDLCRRLALSTRFPPCG
jgi:shikimate kinase